MAALSFSQSFKPVGYFIEAFFTGCLGHTWVHIGVFVGLASNGALQVGFGAAERNTCSRVTGLFEIFQMPVSMARFTFSCRAED